jgi:hypothetical protein
MQFDRTSTPLTGPMGSVPVTTEHSVRPLERGPKAMSCYIPYPRKNLAPLMSIWRSLILKLLASDILLADHRLFAEF